MIAVTPNKLDPASVARDLHLAETVSARLERNVRGHQVRTVRASGAVYSGGRGKEKVMALIDPSKHEPRPDMWWKLITASGILLLVFGILSL